MSDLLKMTGPKELTSPCKWNLCIFFRQLQTNDTKITFRRREKALYLTRVSWQRGAWALTKGPSRLAFIISCRQQDPLRLQLIILDVSRKCDTGWYWLGYAVVPASKWSRSGGWLARMSGGMYSRVGLLHDYCGCCTQVLHQPFWVFCSRILR